MAPLLTTKQKHPFNVQPFGNALFNTNCGHSNSYRCNGLGLFARLDDDMLLAILAEYFEPADLLTLRVLSKPFFIFASSDEIWRKLFIDYYGVCGSDRQDQEAWRSEWTWFGSSWIQTYCHNVFHRNITVHHNIAFPPLYSDRLYSTFLNAFLNVPEQWLRTETVDRHLNTELSPEKFLTEYDSENCPVVIQFPKNYWPAFDTWTSSYLAEHLGEQACRAESLDTTLVNYARYMASEPRPHDDPPLYLFDASSFRSSASKAWLDKECPDLNDYFPFDLFQLLPLKVRPDGAWIIIGPSLSSSTFHQDPNGTSAWNMTIRGRKKWILYPPNITPPGVIVEEGKNVKTAVSGVSWLVSYYASLPKEDGRLEIVTEPGDLMFVPSGWWHMVVNLDDSIAVTKNLATKGCIRKVYDFFKRGEKEEQKLLDSGFVLGDDDIGGGLVSGLPDGVTSSQMCKIMKQCALETGIDLDETEDNHEPALKKQRQHFWQSVDTKASFSMSNLFTAESPKE